MSARVRQATGRGQWAPSPRDEAPGSPTQGAGEAEGSVEAGFLHASAIIVVEWSNLFLTLEWVVIYGKMGVEGFRIPVGLPSVELAPRVTLHRYLVGPTGATVQEDTSEDRSICLEGRALPGAPTFPVIRGLLKRSLYFAELLTFLIFCGTFKTGVLTIGYSDNYTQRAKQGSTQFTFQTGSIGRNQFSVWQEPVAHILCSLCELSEKSSRAKVGWKSSRARVDWKSSRARVDWKSSRSRVGWKSSRARVGWKSSRARVDWKSSRARVDWKSSRARVDWKSSSAKLDWKSSSAKVGWKSSSAKFSGHRSGQFATDGRDDMTFVAAV
uniref:Uncharacterized protein n=1 Tax=Timema monikensis TaxID=170555 RepID=A0A7R9HRX8_9NEOP|nr:unnamed protein product [Timema monikensis]